MSDAADEHAQHRRPHSQPMAAAYLEFDLARELEQLHREPEWSSGQNAKMPVEDSYIAATARRHGLAIATGHDRDFTRPGLKVFNPFKELP